jgi:hypothetical protein
LGAGDREPLGQFGSPALPWQLSDPLKLPQQMRGAQRMGGLGAEDHGKLALAHIS